MYKKNKLRNLVAMFSMGHDNFINKFGRGSNWASSFCQEDFQSISFWLPLQSGFCMELKSLKEGLPKIISVKFGEIPTST